MCERWSASSLDGDGADHAAEDVDAAVVYRAARKTSQWVVRGWNVAMAVQRRLLARPGQKMSDDDGLRFSYEL